MPTLNGKKTRAEKREENQREFKKAARAVARELSAETRGRKDWGGEATSYTREKEDAIFSRISSGMTLRGACRDYNRLNPKSTIAPETVLTWARKDNEIYTRYARAREDQAESWSDDLIEEAEDADPDTVNVARLRINTKQWLMGKNHVRRYGDKVILEGGEKPIEHDHTHEHTVRQLSDSYSNRIKRIA